jgi:hypothetical protein
LVAGNGDVVVVNEHLEVQLLGHGEPGRLGIVPLHLAAIGTQQDDGLAGVGHRHAIAKSPQMAETTRAEFHAGSEKLLRVARQAALILPIVQQSLRRHGAIEHAQQILRGDPVSRLIVKDRHDRCAVCDERSDDRHLGNCVVSASRMTRQSFGSCQSGEKYNGITAKLNVASE